MARQPTPRPRLRLGQFRAKGVDTMHECFANPERNDGFGADSSPSRDDPCRRALRPMEASKAAIRNGLLYVGTCRPLCANSSPCWTVWRNGAIDPRRTFKIGPVNGRETQESGRRVKSDAPIAVI